MKTALIKFFLLQYGITHHGVFAFLCSNIIYKVFPLWQETFWMKEEKYTCCYEKKGSSK